MSLKAKCSQCSKEFEPSNKRNIYCSDGCKQEAYRKRHGIETPNFLKPEDEKYHVFKSEKKEIVYREVLTREYSDLRAEIQSLRHKLSNAQKEEKAIEDKIEKVLTRNDSFFRRKAAAISTVILGSFLGLIIYPLIKFTFTRKVLGVVSIPFIVVIVIGAFIFQRKSDTKNEEDLLNLSSTREKLKQVRFKTAELAFEIEKNELKLKSVPQFEKLTEEQTKEIEEKIKQPKFGLPQIKENEAKGVMSLNELKKAQFRVLAFNGAWKELIGTPEERFSLMLYGQSGHGKSYFAMQFAEYLSNNFGTVLYNSAEEGMSLTLQSKIKELKSNNLFISKHKDFSSIKKALKSSNCKFVVLDSVNHMDLTPEQVEELRNLDSTRGFVSIHQVNKNGEFKGNNKFLHNCDVEIMVQDRKPIVKKCRFVKS